MDSISKAIKQFGKPLIGVSLGNYDPLFVEICGRLGFHVLWIEMEHSSLTYGEALDLTRIAQGSGMLAMIRTPNASRSQVTKAAESGPDIIDVPMAEDLSLLEQLLHHARYRPLGNRGFYDAGRANNYGMGGTIVERQTWVNEHLNLMVQIETAKGVERVEELCQIPGINSFLIGKGDLSQDLGVVGQLNHPKVEEAVDKIVAAIKKHKKQAVCFCRSEEIEAWARRGFDVLFLTNNIFCYTSTLKKMMVDYRKCCSTLDGTSEISGERY